MGKYIKLYIVERVDKKVRELVWLDNDYYDRIGCYAEYNGNFGKIIEQMDVYLSNVEGAKELNLFAKLSGQKIIYKIKQIYNLETMEESNNVDLNNYADILEGIE